MANYFTNGNKQPKKKEALKNLYVSQSFHKWLKKESGKSGLPMYALADQLMELATTAKEDEV